MHATLHRQDSVQPFRIDDAGKSACTEVHTIASALLGMSVLHKTALIGILLFDNLRARRLRQARAGTGTLPGRRGRRRGCGQPPSRGWSATSENRRENAGDP